MSGKSAEIQIWDQDDGQAACWSGGKNSSIL